MRGKLVIFSGPSGVGKDTVLNEWMRQDPRVRRVVAYTTRSPREGEVDGLDYHFVSDKVFKKLADQGAFLEHKNVYGNFYATPLTDMEDMLAQGQIAILKIDVKGALTAMELRPDALTVFILPPSDEELERRIVGRGTDDEETIRKRLSNAQAEIALSKHYQHRIVNDDISRAVAELRSVVAE
jgi:guanylate kinase